jgi:hypothetical protein
MPGGGWDELMDALRKDGVYGLLTIQLKDGLPTLITMNRTFKSVDEAVRAATKP